MPDNFVAYSEFLRLLSAAGNTITWELVKIKSYKHPNTWQTYASIKVELYGCIKNQLDIHDMECEILLLKLKLYFSIFSIL